jgi:class 3 adenylate cyclase
LRGYDVEIDQLIGDEVMVFFEAVVTTSRRMRRGARCTCAGVNSQYTQSF